VGHHSVWLLTLISEIAATIAVWLLVEGITVVGSCVRVGRRGDAKLGGGLCVRIVCVCVQA